jgi:hypothetical protein
MIPTKPSDLAEWLEIATDGLAVPGRERVRREVGAHFGQAVRAHMAEGESEPVAKINALEELGDARTAQKDFRKRHLTKDEEKHLVTLRETARSKFVLATNLIIGFTSLFFLLRLNSKSAFLTCLPVFIALIILPVFAFWRLRHRGTESKLSTLLLIQFFAVSPFSGPIVSSIVLDANRPFIDRVRIPLIGLLLIWFAFCILAYQTWRKIRKNENPAIGT